MNQSERDELLLIINKLRGAEKVAYFQMRKELSDSAQMLADIAAGLKEPGQPITFRFEKPITLTQPAPPGTSPQRVIDMMDNNLRGFLVSKSYLYIGIGLAVAKDGNKHYVFVLVGQTIR